MIRLARIAWREYLAYIRTLGFWLSIILLPGGLFLYVLGPMAVQRSTPVGEIAVADFTGRNFTADIATALKSRDRAKPLAELVAAPGGPYATPAQATVRLKSYLVGERRTADGGRLEAAAIIVPRGGTVAIDYWSRNIGDRNLEWTVQGAVRDGVHRQRFEAAGLTPEMVSKINALDPPFAAFSPKAEKGKVSIKDRLPALTGFFMGLLLWMVILSGAGMLLNSIIEEKSSKILEVLLSSASVPEIMGGKILGVAAVSATVLTVWISIACIGMAIRFPEAARDLVVLLFGNGMVFYFGFYFVAGYLMFATLYVTIGAFCESVREAQTLLAPMMIFMSAPIIFMGQTMSTPDSPLLSALKWFPPFTPFMMAARAGIDPPWEIVATGLLIIAVTAAELWFAVPAFKSGALATGRFEFRRFVASVSGRLQA